MPQNIFLPWKRAGKGPKRNSSGPPQLPIDLIDLIFRQFIFVETSIVDLPTLRSCALVSHSFHNLVQPHLFSTLSLQSRKQCERFLAVLLHNIDLRTYVREVHIMDKGWPCSRRTCPLTSPALIDILNIVATNGVLCCVRFKCVDDGTVGDDRDTKPPRGSILDIANMSLQRTKSPGVRLFRSMSDAPNKSLVSTSPPGNSQSLPQIVRGQTILEVQSKASSPLKSLGLGGLESQSVMTFLRGPYCALNMTDLKQLIVYAADPRTLAAVRDVVNHPSSGIERFLVYQPLRMDYFLSEILVDNIVDLSRLDKLRDYALLLRQPDHLGHEFLSWASKTLLPKTLESISIIMTARFTECLRVQDGRAFKYLDAAVHNITKRETRLEAIYVYVVEGADLVTERIIEDALPKLNNTGLLRVKILHELGPHYLPSVDFTVNVDGKKPKAG